jgi:hypothetical protein
MRRIAVVGFGCLIALVAFSLTRLDLLGEEKKNGAPAPIMDYYDDLNFVSSFSTLQERAQLAAYLPDGSLPEKYRGGRLEKVFDRTKKLRARDVSIDPKMTVNPNPKPEYLLTSGLVKVESVNVTGNKATVDVSIYALTPTANFWFISQYDKLSGDAKKVPSFEEFLRSTFTPLSKRTEIHTWVKLVGEWRKQEVNIIPLK